MTSNTSGNQWLRTANPAFAKPVNTAAFPFCQQTPRSFPRETLNSSSLRTASSGEASQPVAKRQRLSDGVFKTEPDVPHQSSAPSLLQRVNSSVNHASSENPEESAPSQGILARSNDKTRRRGSKFPILPIRPAKRPRSKLLSNLAISTTERANSRGQVSTKPYVAESPSSAPRFKQDGPADFHPWTGHHLEDVLNESTMKSGSFDKAHPSQNESTTAKSAVWSSLKHKSSLQTLSSLFVSVLDQRQYHGTVTANCTFKPPPRVTLTDTKREIWLRDLANPDIPLRRLSRTIPHGIRGKVLLDQCLTKAIPVPRAVWLAKCVGANEIRAFKRKGAGGAFAVGGESKWIKEWTSNVEQFVENIISLCGSSDWRTHIDYGLRFTTHLVSEHLLDQDHYLSWILTSLQETDLENLPIWILIMQLQFNELTRERRRGRHLVEALLKQLRKASEPPNSEVYGSVIQTLMKILRSMIINAPDCFLLPSVWSRYEATLRSQLDEADADACACFEQISRRNACFTNALRENTWQRLDTPRKRLINLLDTMPVDGSFVRLAKACLKTTSDFDLLVATSLEWATSVHRNGDARIYLVAHLLRHCGTIQAGLDNSIMKFLASVSTLPDLSMSAVYKVLAELLRSKHLSAGRFLSWLMARGRLHERLNSDQDGPSDVQFLLEMPIQGMPLHILNLRQILLSKVGVTTVDEDQAIASLKAEVASKIPGFFPPIGKPLVVSAHSLHRVQSSIAVKFTISHWIREAVAAHCYARKAEKTAETVGADETARSTGTNKNVPWTSLTLNQFQNIRNIMEDLGDFAMLADILNIVSDSEDFPVLTAVCDTISYHFSTFAAIGAHNSLFRNLMQQHDNISVSKPVDQYFVESLIDLGRCLPIAAKHVNRLKQQALLYQQVSSITACSPISDTMVEASQCGESTSGEDIEHILASGTSIDKQMITKLFSLIIIRLESSWSDSAKSTMSITELLNRLRRFGRTTFDGLIHGWIGHILQESTAFTPVKSLLPLICAGCLTLDGLLDTTTKVLRTLNSADQQATLAMNIIELLASINADEALRTIQKGYRPRLQYERTLRRRPILVVPCLQVIFDTYPRVTNNAKPYMSTQRRELRRLVNDLAVYNLPAFNELSRSLGASGLWDELSPASISHGGPSRSRVEDWLTSLDSSLESLRQGLSLLLTNVNEFNLPFCQSRLNALLSESTISACDPTAALHSAVVEGVSMLKQASKTLWPAMMSGLTAHQSSMLRHYAENEILAGIPCEGKPLTSESEELAETLLSIVNATITGPLDTAAFPITQITEKLKNVLASQPPSPESLNLGSLVSSVSDAISVREKAFSVHILLRLLAVQQRTPQHPEFPQPALYELIISLSLLSASPFFRDQASLAAYTIDLIALFSDFLSGETRSRCVRTLREHHHVSDRQLCFVLGYPEDVHDEWLQLLTGLSMGAGAKTSEIAPPSVTASQPFPLRRWEMMQDATPVMGENDTSLSLTLFGARKSCM